MKNFRTIAAVVALVIATALSANAQIFRWGPRLGTQVNSLHLNKDVFNSDNRAGFTGGLQMEVNVPVIGIGFDLSAMYVHRTSDATGKTENAKGGGDYIEIPLNFKYKIGLPIIGKIVTPYVFTGPSVSFLTSKKAINEAYKNKSVDFAWNVGVGLQLIDHLQVSASYGFGLTKAIETVSSYQGAQPIDGKNRYWTVTAAWLF